ncbi:hypothetical protein H311_00863, partial [Anncaliia algerae PRA109]
MSKNFTKTAESTTKPNANILKKVSNSHYHNLLKYILMNLSALSEITILFFLKSFELLQFNNNVYFYSIVISNMIFILLNMALTKFKRASFVNFLMEIIIDISRIGSLSYSLSTDNDNISSIYNENTTKELHLFKIYIIFTSVAILFGNLSKICHQK